MSGGREKHLGRRDVLRSGLRLSLVVLGTTACGRQSAPDACLDVTGLAPADAQARTVLGYAEPAPDKSKGCGSCQQYLAAKSDGACGSCKVLKGPIHPNGTCKAFAPKSA
jgi:hypothetical protein